MKYFIALALLFLSASLVAQTSLINVYNRTTISLAGEWKYIVDPYENGFYNYRYIPFENQKNPGNGAFFTNAKPSSETDLIEYDFDKSESIQVPGDWNTQKEKLFYYEGTVWYKKSFDYEKSGSTNRVFLYFEASNYETDVYFNGHKLGKHVGGFTPFHFEVTHLVEKKGNFVVVKVDNKRRKEGVPTLNTDWWNYGGLTRDVKLVETSETFISDYDFHLADRKKNTIVGHIQLHGESKRNQSVTVNIPALKKQQTIEADEDGRVSLNWNIPKLTYWSNENPHMYDVLIETSTDTITDQLGFRTIETKGSSILLNGNEIFLKGICLHEESPFGPGRAHTKEDAVQLLTWAKELGCNYVRLAHYPHNEHMVRVADEMGMLVWEENPVYWTIDWENEDTFQNAQNQLTEVINRDKNRASVIIWSMANETPTSDARNSFLNRLATHTRELDPTRLISAALEQRDYEGNPAIRTIDDPFAETVDVLSFNQYIGWYDGLPEKCERISWEITQDKPVLISEFGAGAKYGVHGNVSARWTEEYQAHLYEETLKMLDRIDQLAGFSPWILVDFRSPRRVLPEIQDGWNRKGLLSEDGQKKMAYYILQSYYFQK